VANSNIDTSAYDSSGTGLQQFQQAFEGQNPQLQDIEKQQLSKALGISAPTLTAVQAAAPQVSQTGAGATTAALGQLLQQSKTGSTIAQEQFKQALGASQQANIGAAESAGGRNPNAALYAAFNANANAGQTAASNSAIQTAQEKLAATQGLGQLGSAVQGQNLNEAQFGLGANQFNATAANQVNQNNVNNNLAAYDASLRGLTGAAGTTQQEALNTQNEQNLASSNANAARQQAIQQAEFNAGQTTQLESAGIGALGAIGGSATKALTGGLSGLGDIGGGGGGGGPDWSSYLPVEGGVTGNTANGSSAASLQAAKSDKNAKKDIKDASSDIEGWLDSVSRPKTYEYKDKQDGDGKQTGAMAQDMEKSDIGKRMVKDTPKGKVVEYDGNALNTIVAALGHLHSKLNELAGDKEDDEEEKA
jgi:hypothetical protein